MFNPDDYTSIDEFTEMHQIAPNWVRMSLRDEADLPDDQKRIPGAFKLGEGKRGVWYIPRTSAAAFVKDRRGRPRGK